MQAASSSLYENMGVAPQKLSDNIAVWSEMKDLMVKYNALSLGEGAPNLMPPDFLIEDMYTAMKSGAAANQYTRTFGVPALVQKIAQIYGPKIGREIDPMKEVLVTQGANGALMAFIAAFCNEGEHVACFEPMFPLYIDHAEFSSSNPVLGVPLTLQDGIWKFDPEQLRAELSKPTCKVFVFNSPHNPTGKVFTVEEMQQISDILDDCPHVLTLSDEVYDFATFDGRTHTNFASVGNNWDRTVSIFSGGKLLNATGWKIGWTIGPERLIYHGCVIANTVFYCFNTPGQIAVANSLDKTTEPNYNGEGVNYVESTRDLFCANRDFIASALSEMAMPWTPVPVEGGYFLMADITACSDLIPDVYKNSHEYEPDNGSTPVKKYHLNMPDGKIPLDLAFCRWMAIEKGVVMMPNSFFYHKNSPTMTDKYVRLAICKERKSTEAAINKLRTALD